MTELQKPNPPDSGADSDSDGERLAAIARTRSEQALRMVSVNMPWLSPLVYAVRVIVDKRIHVAAVTQTGRILVNPHVFSAIPLRDATYVMAHELLHLALDTFSRETSFDDPETVNRAHDYIINDLLRRELNMSPPLGGLDLHDAADWSLEKVVAWMNEDQRPRKQFCWNPGPRSWETSPSKSKVGSLSSALQAAGLVPADPTHPQIVTHGPFDARMDVIFPAQEHELFPSDSPHEKSATHINASLAERIRAAARQASALKTAADVTSRAIKGSGTGDQSIYLQALRSHCQPPWQRGLQRWMEAVAPGQRTYARPSRRGADRQDCVLPGRNREGWTLHIVLDTSGSMSDDLPKCLGAITDFCEASGVAEVHILQCDASVTVDEWVPVEELEHYRITGFGGSDMSPAMQHLASDPEVEAVVVITDGLIDYPPEMPEYDVLWVLTSNQVFTPLYGTVLRLN